MADDFKEIIARAQAIAAKDVAASPYIGSEGEAKKIVRELGNRTKSQILETEQAEINWSRFAHGPAPEPESPEGKKLFDEKIKAESALFGALQKAVAPLNMLDPATAQAFVLDITKAAGEYGFERGQGGDPQAPLPQTPAEPPATPSGSRPALRARPGRTYNA
jgi:hypothetical protein